MILPVAFRYDGRSWPHVTTGGRHRWALRGSVGARLHAPRELSGHSLRGEGRSLLPQRMFPIRVENLPVPRVGNHPQCLADAAASAPSNGLRNLPAETHSLQPPSMHESHSNWGDVAAKGLILCAAIAWSN